MVLIPESRHAMELSMRESCLREGLSINTQCSGVRASFSNGCRSRRISAIANEAYGFRQTKPVASQMPFD